jgi:hypothetical protein
LPRYKLGMCGGLAAMACMALSAAINVMAPPVMPAVVVFVLGIVAVVLVVMGAADRLHDLVRDPLRQAAIVDQVNTAIMWRQETVARPRLHAVEGTAAAVPSDDSPTMPLPAVRELRPSPSRAAGSPRHLRRRA